MTKYPLSLLLWLVVVRVGTVDGANQAESQSAPFTAPEGFIVERVAGPPLVEHPMFACFDDRGRLLVSDSLGINLVTRKEVALPSPELRVSSVKEALEKPAMLIRRLEDSDKDGQFEKGTIFADRLTYPQGVLWHDGAVYSVSPPGLWRLSDADGDGVADRREELITGLVITGAADDAHGPCLGPDGRLYWCHGRFAHELRGPNGMVVARGPGPRVYRCRPDGTEVEMLSAALGNAVDVAFSPEGEAFTCGTFFFPVSSEPLRDAMIQCVEGGVFPVTYRAITLLEGHRTGDLLPPVVGMIATAPSGLMRYRSGGFGADYHNNLFMALYNMHSIQRIVLERHGATFRARSEDFLVSSDPNFHPTDVLEDADGSLLVVDTGRWFENCPTSGVGKSPVKGGIYRIRRANAAEVEDPRGLQFDWDRMNPVELARLLDDDRWMVRDRAVAQLAKCGPCALTVIGELIRTAGSERARRNALWTLARIEGAEARGVSRSALADKDASVRLTAVNVAGLYRDEESLPQLLKLLGDDNPAIRREAATAMGRIGRAEAVAALFNALRAGGDRFLEHSLIYAIIRIDNRAATLPGLADPSPLVRRAALIAMDQMDHGDLTRDLVTPLLNSDDPALQKTALAIITARPGWAEEVVGLLRQWLAEPELPADRVDGLSGALLAFANDEPVQALVAQTLAKPQTSPVVRLVLLESIARAPLDKLPAPWVDQLGRHLEARDKRVVLQAIECLRAARIADFDEQLLRLMRDPLRPADLRVAALAAAAPRLAKVDPGVFDFVRQQVNPDLPPLERLAAAQALGNTHLDDRQLAMLTNAVAQTGSLELPHLLAAFEKSQNSQVGQGLLAALDKSPGVTSLSPDLLRRTLATYPDKVREAAEPLVARLAVDTEKQKARLAELEPVLANGDAQRGREVFFGKTASCSACHTIESQGGQVGPNLSKIGGVRTGRDLLEAIVFPSASFARGYEPHAVTTIEGKVYTGVVRRETADAIHLVSADRAEVRLRRADIDAMQRANASIMPQGLDAQLSPQDLGDLIVFLSSLK